jgi:hypothetical protein
MRATPERNTVTDPLDQIAKSMRARKTKGPKAARTHNFAEPNYTLFARYCKSKGVPASEVLDDLIVAFLEKVKDDMPGDGVPDGDDS